MLNIGNKKNPAASDSAFELPGYPHDLMRQGSVLRGPFGPFVSRCRLDRNGPFQRKSRYKPRRSRSWWWRRLMVRRRGTAHFVPSDVSGDVLVKRRQLPVAPVFMEDVELQCLALDFEVVQCRHGVGVIAGPADHTAELVANFLNDEVLLGGACAKAQPDPDNVLL